MTGEYVAEFRTDPMTDEWRPALDLDPVPDNDDLATERAAEAMRGTVTKLNRQVGFYKYRTRYVPAQLCQWFAKCDRPATHLEPHPVLGPVPACDRCPVIGR